MNWETILKREISSFTASSYENRRKFIIISEVIPNEISVFWGYGDENYPKYDEEIMNLMVTYQEIFKEIS